MLRDEPLLLMEPINPSLDAPDAAQTKATQFADKWSGYSGSEVRHYQGHFNELCELVDHGKPADRPDSDDFQFEQPAPTLSNRNGFADVWLRDHFVMEYKRSGRNLDDAYAQTLRYRDSLGNPPLLIVSDFETIRIHTNFTGTVSDTYTITLDDLRQLERQASRKSAMGDVSQSPLSVYQVLHNCFRAPGNLKPTQTPNELTEKAAELFKQIADELQGWNHNKHTEIARLLSQMLFCMFASDMGLLQRQQMTRLTEMLGASPRKVFPERLARLYEGMSFGDPISAPPIKRFNGGLFDGEPHDLEIGNSIIPFVQQADALDWSQVDPSIFGTLFERVFNPDKRAQYGRHYTSREDIEMLVEPVVMAPLRRDWEKTKSNIDVAEPEDAHEKTQGFLDRLGSARILDPACGLGNFLYVALNLLHALEREVITWALERNIDAPEPRVHPRQLLGIEIDEYAHQLASVVVWIGHIQNGLRVGSDIENRDPILDPLDNIDCRDAILDTTSGESRPAEWPEVDFIIGNPPFLGNRRMRMVMGDEVVERIYAAWKGRVPNGADLCAYWFEKARSQISDGKAQRAGLLATQGIRGGRSRVVLENIKEFGDIFFAVSDRDWILDGAAVHISMVGFDDGSQGERELDGDLVGQVNADLTSRRADLTKARQLSENEGIAFMGVTPVGPFDMTEDEATRMLGQSNPSGRSNAEVIKPFINARDMTDRSRNRWIIDFGIHMSMEEAASFSLPFDHVEANVKPIRENSPSAQNIPFWIYQRPRPEMREALKGLKRFIVTPLVSKHRLFKWAESPLLADHAVGVFARDDDYFFGVVHSRVHEVWARAKGTQVRERESGFRYTHTTCFETFPFPSPTDEQRDAIVGAAKTLDWHRNNVLTPLDNTPDEIVRTLTLTNLYNDMHTWLRMDHERLDRAVFDAYGWDEAPAELDDDTILERLLELNLSREPA